MRELKDFIKDKKIDFKKLEEFGFKLKDNSYHYNTFLLKNQFKMTVIIQFLLKLLIQKLMNLMFYIF